MSDQTKTPVEKKPCPRMIEDGRLTPRVVLTNKPEDDRCDYCGSIDGDHFMARLEAGDVTLDPTDKNYKVYVKGDPGTAKFRMAYRTDKRLDQLKPGDVVPDPNDQSLWTWAVREDQEGKFYFQHLTEAQMKRFVELLNEGKLRLGYPGRFYCRPFFIQYKEPAPAAAPAPTQE